MRIKELIGESKKIGKITPRQRQATRGLNVFSDAERANTDYTQYRLTLALACSNGTDPLEVDAKTWHGKRKTAHPYTQEEQDMLTQSYEAVGAKYEDLNHGDLRSQEMKDVNKVSTSKPFAGYKTKK